MWWVRSSVGGLLVIAHGGTDLLRSVSADPAGSRPGIIGVMRLSRATLIGVANTVVVVGLLLGCAGSDDDAAAIDPTTPVETTDAATDAATDATTDTTTAVTQPPATDAPVATDPPATDPPPATDALVVDDGDCLVGDWVVTEDQMNAYYAGLMSTLEAPLGIDAAGSASLSFAADGTYGWAPGFALTVDVAGQAGTGDVSGTVNGSWTAVGGVVTTSSDVNALVVEIVVNGVTFGGDDLVNGLLTSSPVNGVTYSCDGPTPVLDFKTGDPAVTVPVTMAPA